MFGWVRAQNGLIPCLWSTLEKTREIGKGKDSTKGRRSGCVLDSHQLCYSQSAEASCFGANTLARMTCFSGEEGWCGDERAYCCPREGADAREHGQTEWRIWGGLASGTPWSVFLWVKCINKVQGSTNTCSCWVPAGRAWSTLFPR